MTKASTRSSKRAARPSKRLPKNRRRRLVVLRELGVRSVLLALPNMVASRNELTTAFANLGDLRDTAQFATRMRERMEQARLEAAEAVREEIASLCESLQAGYSGHGDRLAGLLEPIWEAFAGARSCTPAELVSACDRHKDAIRLNYGSQANWARPMGELKAEAGALKELMKRVADLPSLERTRRARP